jgi:glutamate racemase
VAIRLRSTSGPAPAREGAVGVLASGAGGLAVVAAIERLLPHEDVLFLADHAYAPYARRPAAVVVDRLARLGDDVARDGAKALVVASAVGTADALPTLRARSRMPVVGFDGAVAHAVARSRSGLVAVVAGTHCLRGLPFARSIRQQRGHARVVARAWPGLAELVERGEADGPPARALVAEQLEAILAAGVDSLALACPHASSVHALVAELAPPGVAVVDGAELVADRVRVALRRADMLARRQRPGRRVALTSHPTRAAGVGGLLARRARSA